MCGLNSWSPENYIKCELKKVLSLSKEKKEMVLNLIPWLLPPFCNAVFCQEFVDVLRYTVYARESQMKTTEVFIEQVGCLLISNMCFNEDFLVMWQYAGGSKRVIVCSYMWSLYQGRIVSSETSVNSFAALCRHWCRGANIQWNALNVSFPALVLVLQWN